MKIALLIAYDGTRLSGWQVQHNAQSVQSAIENAIFSAFSERARATGSGRTDAGVHAAGQVCSFELQNKNVAPERVADALNRFLPADVRILESVRAEDDFDACRAAKRKTYRYRLYVSERENPLKERYAVKIPKMPDLNQMQRAADILVGEHDFKSFSAVGSSAKTTVRTVYGANIALSQSYGSADLAIDVCGNGFLYNMVRIIAGTLVAAGYGKITLQDIARSFESGNRELLGKTMPAKGLTLLQVEYAAPLFAAENGGK